jgi:hypothetical protein
VFRCLNLRLSGRAALSNERLEMLGEDSRFYEETVGIGGAWNKADRDVRTWY